MTTMIEQVARALCVADRQDPDHLEPGDAFGIDGHKANGDPAHFYWKHYIGKARAAIEAMRKPNAGMKRAVNDIGGPQALAWGLAAWPTMIDAALKEGPNYAD